MYRLPRLLLALLMLAGSTYVVFAQSSQTNGNMPSVQMQQQAGQANEADESLSPQSEDRLIREIRHALIMLPYYGVFDNLAYRVNGRTVILEGQVVKPVTKSDAESAVKRIEGVDKVINNIEVLPLSSNDDRIRREVYRRVYSGPLFKYANMAVPPIHIIVKSGNVTLDGVVDNEGDKNLAGIRTNQTPGVFKVTNNLRVLSSGENPKKK